MSTTILATARDKIKTCLDELKEIMATGYDPTFSYVYDRHVVSSMQVPAATVDIEPVDTEENDWPISPVSTSHYRIIISIRYHTGYSHNEINELDNIRMLNSFDNYLAQKQNLGDGYRVIRSTDINSRVDFPDSGSVGGEINFEIMIPVERSQS